MGGFASVPCASMGDHVRRLELDQRLLKRLTTVAGTNALMPARSEPLFSVHQLQ